MSGRRRAYLPGREAPAVAGRTVIVVDNVVATGNTAKAALRALRQGRPGQLVLAVPVAEAAAVEALAGRADEVVCLHTPGQLRSVGEHYADFAQTTDAEVIRFLGVTRTLVPV